MSSRGWLIWFLTSFGSFLIFEIGALATGHPERTLSAAIWRLEKFIPGQAIPAWNAFHFLFIATLLVLDVWLIGHFGFRIWT